MQGEARELGGTDSEARAENTILNAGSYMSGDSK
jgi:hypothetical protein